MNAYRICFKDENYNYITSFNGSYDDATSYFKGKYFNLGAVSDNMQQCINVEEVNN